MALELAGHLERIERMKRWMSLLTIAIFVVAFATPVVAGSSGSGYGVAIQMVLRYLTGTPSLRAGSKFQAFATLRKKSS